MAEVFNALMLLVFALMMGGAIYYMLAGDALFRYIETNYPDYYEKAGRPRVSSINPLRSLNGGVILNKLVYGQTPTGFPQDKRIKDKVGRIQLVFIGIVVGWVLFALLIFRSAQSN